MVVNCQIILHNPKEGVFRAGQPVSGSLKYNIEKPTQFASLDISLKGKGKCQWSETGSDQNSTTYFENKEEYVNLYKKLYTGRNYLSGNYERSFEFFLPENIPTSMRNRTCTIDYKIFVTFVKNDFFGTKYKFDTEVLVYGYVSPCSPEPLVFDLQKNVLSLTSNNNLDVKIQIEKTYVTPGENFQLNLRIHNDTDVPVIIKTELLKYFTYVAEDKSKKIDEESVKTATRFSPSIEKRSVFKMKRVVPTLPSLYTIQNTNIVLGEYKVRVTAQLPFPHTNAVVVIPVVIGEGKGHVGAALVGYKGPSSSKMLEEEYKEYFAKYDKTINDYYREEMHLVSHFNVED